MRRYEATREIMNAIGDELVVCNIGHPSQEIFELRDRPENFYMFGSMGLSSSIGLGVAMAQDRMVVALDGDGSVTMNMGTLATIGLVRPKNYMLVIIDNQSYGSTGFQRSFTADNLRLEEVARGSGVEERRGGSSGDRDRTDRDPPPQGGRSPCPGRQMRAWNARWHRGHSHRRNGSA